MIDQCQRAFMEGANVFSGRSVMRLELRDPPEALSGAAFAGLVDILRGIDCVHAHADAATVDALMAAAEVPALSALLALGIEFQRRAGAGLTEFGTFGQGRGGIAKGWFDTFDLQLGDAALRAALTYLPRHSAGHGPARLRMTATEQLDLVLEAMWRQDGPNPRMIERCADRSDIHWRPLLPNASYGMLGIGARSIRFEKSHFEIENVLSNSLQTDKMRCSFLLAQGGISVPRQVLATSEAEAVAAAATLGYPLITKPQRGSRAQGITMQIRSETALREGYQRAVLGEDGVVIEQYITGTSHRFFVMRGELIDTSTRVPISVTGDGRTTIRGLVERFVAEPDRGEGWRFRHHAIDISRLEQAEQAPYRDLGYRFDSVLPKGETVAVSYFGGGLNGGTSSIGKTEFHPEYRRIARRVVELLNMPVCAIDLISTDIAAPPTHATYAIHEVNAWIGFHPFLRLGPDDRRYDRNINTVVGPAEDLRVPVITVLTEPGVPSIAPILAAALSEAGQSAVCASRNGYWVDGRRIEETDHAGLSGFQRALDDRQAELIVSERFVDEMFRDGLGLRKIDAALLIPPQPASRSGLWSHSGYLRTAARRGAALLHSGGSMAFAPVDLVISAQSLDDPCAARHLTREVLVAAEAGARMIDTATGTETALEFPATPGLGRASGLVVLALRRLLGDLLGPRDARLPNQANMRHWQGAAR